MMCSQLLSRRLDWASSVHLTESQIGMDAILGHFSQEASNPITLTAMTLGGLAYRATKLGVLSLGTQRTLPLLSKLSAPFLSLCSEVTVFRGVNQILSPHSSTSFWANSSWFTDYVNFASLKFFGHLSLGQNPIFAHVFQDIGMLVGHHLAYGLNLATAPEGSLVQQFFHAEAMQWQMKAGNALSHALSRGRIARLEQRLSLQSEILSKGFNRIEPRWNSRLLQMAAAADVIEIPTSLRLQLVPRSEENAKQWAQRLLDYTSTNPEAHALHVTQHLYEQVRNKETRSFTIQALRQMVSLTIPITEGENILVREYPVPGLKQPLLLVSLPSTFLPEAWSHTFVRGMAAQHQIHPQERNLAIEVGSGTGFVSIAMAKLGMAKRVIATDKNFHAPIIGKLNAAINGVEDRIEFQKGDLLADIPEGISADLIVGCLPQMPSERTQGEIKLRDLADYAENRGVFEDQLGLGLNATVIEQARSRLGPEGKLRLMMAERPGLSAVRDLFRVRGFSPRILHSAFIQQDPSTDFAALGRIEAEYGFRFEFLTHDRQRISASEALGLSREAVFHDLHVVEATPFRQIMERTLRSLTPEKTPWGYTEDPGTENPALLEASRVYLEGYWGTEIDRRTLFIAPSHDFLMENVFRVVLKPGDKLGTVGTLDESTAQILARQGLVTETLPLHLTELSARLETDPPKAMVLRLPRQIVRDHKDLENLLLTAIRKHVFMIFVEHEGGLVNSEGRVLLDLLAKMPQAAEQSVILHPFDKLFGLPTLPLTIGIIPDTHLHQRASHMGDATYSRVSSLIQAIYERFLSQEEIQHRITVARAQTRRIVPGHWERLPSPPLAQQLDAASVFQTSPRSNHPDPIDMSFGESEWRAPIDLGTGYSRALFPPRHELARERLVRFLAQERGIMANPDQVILGNGVHPLIYSSIRAMAALHPEDRIEVILPDPSYGMFEPTLWAAGAQARHILTRNSQGFLLEPKALDALPPAADTRRVLLLNVPTNPPGQYYPPAQIAALAEKVDYLLLDEVFAGTYFRYPWRTPDFQNPELQNKVVLFGGLAKEIGLGGVRFGYAYTFNSRLREQIATYQAISPDPVATELAIESFQSWDNLAPVHRQYLQDRARALDDFFRARRIDVHSAQGGFSMFVNLSHLLDGRHRFRGTVLSSQNFHELLMQEAGIKIKSDQWAQMPGHYRFVFSIHRIDEAIQRLNQFWDQIEGP